jgi:hypothetical protein
MPVEWRTTHVVIAWLVPAGAVADGGAFHRTSTQ